VDDVAVVPEVQVQQGEVGRHRLGAALLAGVVGDAGGQEVDRAVAEGEVHAGGVQAGPGGARAARVAGAAGVAARVGRGDRPGRPADDRGEAAGADAPGPNGPGLEGHVALADHDRVAGAVGHVPDADGRAAVADLFADHVVALGVAAVVGVGDRAGVGRAG